MRIGGLLQFAQAHLGAACVERSLGLNHAVFRPGSMGFHVKLTGWLRALCWSVSGCRVGRMNAYVPARIFGCVAERGEARPRIWLRALFVGNARRVAASLRSIGGA